jgi:hypothetical protein
MKKILFFFILGIIALQLPMNAEIQVLTIRWTPQLCQKNCIQLVERELRKIPGVKVISLDQGSGQATLTWKEGIPFQFSSINMAMRMVGLSIRDIRIKVTGRIQHNADIFYIVSNHDNTRFELLNPITPVRGGSVVEYNVAARKILPALQQQLLEGETQKLTATIEGPIFMPQRNTIPSQIVLDSLSFDEKDKELKK